MGDVSGAGKTHHTVERSVSRSLLVGLGFLPYGSRLPSIVVCGVWCVVRGVCCVRSCIKTLSSDLTNPMLLSVS